MKKLEKLKAEIGAVSSKIEGKSTLLADKPNSPALTDREKFQHEISRLQWTNRNVHEPMLADFERKILELEQRISEEKAFASQAPKKIEELRLSSTRLADAMSWNFRSLVKTEERMESLAFWIETHPEKIRTLKGKLAQLKERAKLKSDEIAANARASSELERELNAFDERFAAQLQAERELRDGWQAAQDNHAADDIQDDSEPTRGSASRTSARPIAAV